MGSYWGPPTAPLTRETFPMHHWGCALTCSTYIPHCSASPEPQHPLMAPKLQFWAIWGPFGVLLGPPNSTPDPRNSSNSSLGMCPDLFHLYSTLFCQSGATTPPYGYKMTILGHLGPFWGAFGAPIAQSNGSIALPRMCPDLFHPCFILFHQFGDTRPAYGTKWRFWAIWDPLQPIWGPLAPPNDQN